MLTSHDYTDRAIRRPAPIPAPLAYRERWTIETAPDRLSAALRMLVDGSTLAVAAEHAGVPLETLFKRAARGYLAPAELGQEIVVSVSIDQTAELCEVRAKCLFFLSFLSQMREEWPFLFAFAFDAATKSVKRPGGASTMNPFDGKC